MIERSPSSLSPPFHPLPLAPSPLSSLASSVLLKEVGAYYRCLTPLSHFPSPSSSLSVVLSLTHLIPPSPDLEAPFVLLICFSPVSSACHSGQPCLPDAGALGSHRRGCHDNGGHAECGRAGCRADVKWHSPDGLHFSLFSLLHILSPIS